ncbi:MAG: hypothetical protein KDJ37_09815 [Hyphomicrobiaceae bacterium]|nr:hypothetical protein [Hyphomicrobiaceae bacterium]
MYDKLLALVSFLMFAGFVSILGIWVDSTSLRVVLLITVLMCAYDFWRDLMTPSDKNGKGH